MPPEDPPVPTGVPGCICISCMAIAALIPGEQTSGSRERLLRLIALIGHHQDRASQRVAPPSKPDEPAEGLD